MEFPVIITFNVLLFQGITLSFFLTGIFTLIVNLPEPDGDGVMTER